MKHNVWFISPIVALLLCVAPEFPAQANPDHPTDHVSSTQWWQRSVKRQMTVTKNKRYEGCLFGDSISSGVGNTLGKNNFNFAIGGMSTVSLIEQLQMLISNHLKCQKAIIAIGTNDAMYDIPDDMFTNNLEKIIILVRSMGTKQIILLPAFYSTVDASYDPNKAGTITRVDKINELIGKVAVIENVPIESEGIQPLFEEHSLKEKLTNDGVHLNQEGIKIYRQALLNILSSSYATHTPSGQYAPPPSSLEEDSDPR